LDALIGDSNAYEPIADSSPPQTDNQSSTKPFSDNPLSQAEINALFATMGDN
jgi:hypothetical protein